MLPDPVRFVVDVETPKLDDLARQQRDVMASYTAEQNMMADHGEHLREAIASAVRDVMFFPNGFLHMTPDMTYQLDPGAIVVTTYGGDESVLMPGDDEYAAHRARFD